MDLKSKTPEELFTYFYDETTFNRFYSFSSMEFWYNWRQDTNRILHLKQALVQLTTFLRSDVYLEHRGEHENVHTLVIEINNLITSLDKLYEQAENPKGLFKGRKSKRAIKSGNGLLHILKNKIEELHNLIGELSREYPHTLSEKRKIILSQYPCLELRTLEDYETLLKFERDSVFNSRVFIFLNKYVFSILEKNTLTLTRFNLLLQRLNDNSQFKVYFYNVARFRRLFSKDYLSRPCTKDETIFFDTPFFDICLFWLGVVKNTFPYRISLELHNVGTLDNFHEYLERCVKVGHDPYNILKKLSTTKIKIHEELLTYITRIIISLTEGMIDILVLFSLREIHDYGELNLLYNLIALFQKYGDFRNDKFILKKMWELTIEPPSRDIYHMGLFFNIYDKLGKSFFEKLIQNNVHISSSELQDLEVLCIYESLDTKTDYSELITRIKHKENGRKVILVTIPKEDWNLAFQGTYDEIKSIPKDKYEVHFARVTSISQLAIIIKKIALRKKIDIIIIGGHGTPADILLGYRERGVLQKGELETKFFKNIKTYFSENAVCYLASCSTGADEKAIANDVSNTLGIKTYAPPKPTSFSIMVDKDGNLEFKYGSDSGAKMFSPRR